MLKFRDITPNDWDILWEYYKDKQTDNADNSIGNLCCYSFLYAGQYLILDNSTLIVRVQLGGNKHYMYYPPLGEKSFEQVFPLLVQDSKECGYCISFLSYDKKDLENCKPNTCEISSNRNLFDYLYLRSDLESLKGKKYQPKRNHINKFMSSYSYEVRQLAKQDKSECLDMLQTWREQEMGISPEYKRDYDDEQKVIEYLFDWFDELHIFGIGLYVDSTLIAFSLGSPVNNRTFDTHIEKADRNYMGAYTVINKEMAIRLPNNFEYINREEDKGIMGLRQAKLSYNPYKLIEKYMITIKSDKCKDKQNNY